MTHTDRRIIRDLALRVAEVAASDEQQARPGRWRTHNALRPGRPLLFCSPEGAWEELVPVQAPSCEGDEARGIERGLLMRLYAAEHFADDQVCDDLYRVPVAVSNTGWGLEPQYTRPDEARGAYAWDPPIKTRADLDRICTPSVALDPDTTGRRLEFHEDLLGDILQVRLQGSFWWALGLIDEWTRLRGMTRTFWDMTDDPDMVHAGMTRLLEGKLAWLEQVERLGVLTLNNGNHYVGSGGFGFTDELPQPGFEGSVRLADLWGFCDAQTTSEVSPAMHDDFVLPYQVRIMERFGLNCYGCCEPLHRHLDSLLRHVPRLRRVSISPWADKRVSAEKLGNRAIYSWKPNPAPLAGVRFDPDWVRRDVRETVRIARENGCVLEIILKDTHTCNHEPWRFDEWTRIAMEEAQEGG